MLIIAIVLSACLVGCGGCNPANPVDIVEENITIKRIGDTVQLTVKGGDENRSWSTSDAGIATVTDGGLVTAVANGIAEITVTSANTTDTCVIVVRQTVIPEPGLMVKLPKTAVVLNGAYGQTYLSEPTITKNNVAVEGATITWSSSDTSKVTVENGLVTAVANTELGVPAVVTCRVELGSEWAEAKLYVTVEDDVDISFITDQTKFYTTDSEISLPVIAKVNGVKVSNDQVSYSTSNLGVAKIEEGKVVPVAGGDVVIYAIVNGKSKGYNIHIRAKYFVTNATELKNMSSITDDVAYELSNDIEVNTSDFIVADNGSASIKNKDVYLIENFKGELIGNGYKIRYTYDCGYVGNNEFTNASFKGLIKKLESTAVVTDVAFVGDLRLDHPHMYGFIYQNYGKLESCYVQVDRRQVAAGTGYQNHYNTAGGVFERNEGEVLDTIIVGNFFTGETTLSSSGDNLVMAGAKNAGTFDGVAFVSARTAIGNHKNANWNGESAMGSRELAYLVHYTDLDKLIAKDGNRVTNENDVSTYTSSLYKRTACNDQTFSSKWEFNEDSIKLNGRNVWEDVVVGASVPSITLVPGLVESANVTASAEHDSQEFTFSSQNKQVVTVDATGTVTRVGAGSTNIVVTHKVSGSKAIVPVKSYATTNAIDTKAKFLAIGSQGADVYNYLTADIALTTEDAKYTSASQSTQEDDSVADTFNQIFVEEFATGLDGRGHKITINWQSAEKATGEYTRFQGLFSTHSGKIENVHFDFNLKDISDGTRLIASSVTSEGRMENCYISAKSNQPYSKSGNNTATLGVVGQNYGTVENCIIYTDNENAAGKHTGYPLQSHWTGSWKNVAVVAPDCGGAWYNYGAQSKLRVGQLDGVVYYNSMLNFVYGIGKDWLIPSNGKYEFVDRTGVQTISNAFTMDTTDLYEKVYLMGNQVWEREIIEVTDEADFITKMNQASDSTVLKLTKDLTFTTSHFTKETTANGSTGSSEQYQYDMYLIETFNGALLGNGKTITYDITPEGAVERTSDVRVRGFIETLSASAKLSGLKVVGTVALPFSFQTAFCEANYGVVENCYFDVKAIMHNWDGNSVNTIGLFGRNDGTIKNSVLVIDSRRTNQTAWQGMKMVHNGSNSTSGMFENIALVQTAKRIGTRNNANTNGYIQGKQLSNVVYYSSLENLLSSTGELVENTDNNGTFEYTAITTAQSLGSAWTIDSTGIKLNGNYVYTVA